MLSTLFLLVSSVGAWRTYNALRSPDRARVRPLWLPALITSELALHHIVWQAVATALFVWGGALYAWPGKVGLGITLLSWTGHVVLFLRGRGARRALAAVLPAASRNGSRPSLGALVRARPMLPGGVELISGISYGPDPMHLLDLYRPRGVERGAPVIIEIHGGGWMRGRRAFHARPLLHHLAGRGWVCASIDYRLSPRATFPDHLIDTKRAVAWVRSHIAGYGGDPGFVAVTGGSSGAHLAAMVALTPGEPSYQPGFEEADTGIQALIGYYGVYSLTSRDGTRPRWPFVATAVMKATVAEAPQRYRLGSPIHVVNGAVPPTLLLHGTHDSLVSVADSERFAEALRSAGAGLVLFVPIPGANHGFDYFYSHRAFYSAEAVERFLEAVRSGRRVGS